MGREAEKAKSPVIKKKSPCRVTGAGPGARSSDASPGEEGDGRGHPAGFYNDLISAQEYPTFPPRALLQIQTVRSRSARSPTLPSPRRLCLSRAGRLPLWRCGSPPPATFSPALFIFCVSYVGGAVCGSISRDAGLGCRGEEVILFSQ